MRLQNRLARTEWPVVRTLLRWIAALVWGSAVWAEPINTPTEIALLNGAVLKKCSVTKWGKDEVVIRHAGGIAPIQLAHMAPASRSEFERMMAVTYKCAGSAFVVTRGAASLPLAGIDIFVLPENAIQPSSVIKTNAEGRFKFTWKGPGKFTLNATARRLVGGAYEIYVWKITRAEIDDLSEIILSNDNMQ
jgi:hypothetical protein